MRSCRILGRPHFLIAIHYEEQEKLVPLFLVGAGWCQVVGAK